MKSYEEVQEQLDAKIPREAVQERQGGGGMTLSYLTTHYVIDVFNKVFGGLGWDMETTEMYSVGGRSTEATDPTGYVAKVKIKALVKVTDNNFITVTKEGTGYGGLKTGRDGKPFKDAYELAIKEAESDALKRAAMKFGMSLGLALYSKEQENVEDEPTSAPVQASTSVGARRDRVEGVPTKPETAAPIAAAKPTTAPSNTGRDALNKLISSTAKVVLDMKKKTQAELEAMIKAFGKSKKEELTDEQANALLNQLKEILK